jgi:hypothetical protein
MNLSPFSQSVMVKRPPRNDTKGYFGSLKGYDKVFGRLPDFFLQVLDQFSCVLNLLHVDTLSFRL